MTVRCLFLLTRPLRDVTNIYQRGKHCLRISTHTPLAGRDLSSALTGKAGRLISTHTPLAGRDTEHTNRKLTDLFQFLLTRPLRDVTYSWIQRSGRLRFLLTRPLRDVTISIKLLTCLIRISTHTPLAGRDRLQLGYDNYPFYFYSHAPCGT